VQSLFVPSRRLWALMSPTRLTSPPPAQLLEEWEYHFSNSAMQSMKYVLARSTPHAYPQAISQPDFESEQARKRTHMLVLE
jgi:hypothetical protein